MVQDEVNTMPTVKDTHSKKRKTFYEEKINTVMPATSAAVKKTWKRQSNCWSRWHHSRISKSEPVIRICPRLSDRRNGKNNKANTRRNKLRGNLSSFHTSFFCSRAFSIWPSPQSWSLGQAIRSQNRSIADHFMYSLSHVYKTWMVEFNGGG